MNTQYGQVMLALPQAMDMEKYDKVTAVSVKQLRQPAILDLLKKQYNSITLENDMKAEALFTGQPAFVSVEEAKKFLAAGLAVHITELDITIKNPTETSEKSQQEFYVRVFRDLLELRKNGGDISSVTFWGIADNVSWRGDASPLLFLDCSTPKKAYYEVLAAFGEEK